MVSSNTVISLFSVFSVIIIFFGFLIVLPKYLHFKRSAYQGITGHRFFNTILDKGKYGEFLTFSYLEKLKGHHRLLCNLYIPKKNGSTTEIDLLMITETGLYVFESKNYSGWIFGNESNRYWTQSFPNGKKERFYNPIWQNSGHITALKDVLDLNYHPYLKSVIIFSERCQLKNLQVHSSNVNILKRNGLVKYMRKEIKKGSKVLTKDDINLLFTQLEKFTRVDQSIKEQHIQSVKKKTM